MGLKPKGALRLLHGSRIGGLEGHSPRHCSIFMPAASGRTDLGLFTPEEEHTPSPHKRDLRLITIPHLALNNPLAAVVVSTWFRRRKVLVAGESPRQHLNI
jgi:hypothetical protein